MVDATSDIDKIVKNGKIKNEKNVKINHMYESTFYDSYFAINSDI
mgnify:CR=1 FL=1